MIRRIEIYFHKVLYMRNSFITLTFREPKGKKESIKMLSERLVRYNKYFSNFCFYPEFTSTGHIHFHGIIQYLEINEVGYFSFIGNWKKYIGFYYDSCKNHSDIVKWHLYCRKDQSHWNYLRVHKYNYKKFRFRIKKIKNKTIMDYARSSSA